MRGVFDSRAVFPLEEAAPAVQAGMRRISFDDDFTSFDEMFPNAELSPDSVGVNSLNEIKAGFSSPAGQLRINVDDMVSAGAANDFTAIVYLTLPGMAQFTMSAVFEVIAFGAPRAQIMFGAYHLDGDPLTAQVPPNTTNFGTQGPFGGVGIGRTASGVRYFQSRFEGALPFNSSLGLVFFEGTFSVDMFGLGTRSGAALNNTIPGLDAGTSWNNQQAIGIRNPSMSDTHVLRPCLVIRKEAVVNTQSFIDVRRLDMLYNVRAQ